jgi:hypothetical protein
MEMKGFHTYAHQTAGMSSSPTLCISVSRWSIDNPDGRYRRTLRIPDPINEQLHKVVQRFDAFRSLHIDFSLELVSQTAQAFASLVQSLDGFRDCGWVFLLLHHCG